MENCFFERFAALCKKSNETPNAVAKELGIPSGSITAWKKGTEPRYSTVAKIAAYFNVNPDFLLSGVSSQPDPHTEWERQIFSATHRRHAAASRKARRRARTRAILFELVLFAGILLLIALDRLALLSPVVAYPLIILMICVMCFFAGIAVSRKH